MRYTDFRIGNNGAQVIGLGIGISRYSEIRYLYRYQERKSSGFGHEKEGKNGEKRYVCKFTITFKTKRFNLLRGRGREALRRWMRERKRERERERWSMI